MIKNLQIILGKRCFSFSFLNKKMEEEAKRCFYFTESPGKHDHSFILGYQNGRNLSEDWETFTFKGEKWYRNTSRRRETEVLFPENENFTVLTRVLACLYSEFYELDRTDKKRGSDFFIHAAGLIRYGKGFLFTGESGVGKTTIARLSLPEAEILSDESVVISKDNDQYRISQFPVRTELTQATNKSAQLCAVFILIQDRVSALRRLSGAEIIMKLIHNVHYINILPDVTQMDILDGKLRIASAIGNTLPVYELRFRKDNSFWKGIERLECYSGKTEI
jgi:hypothetical protein